MDYGLIIGGYLLVLVVVDGTVYAFMSSQKMPAKISIEAVNTLAAMISPVTSKTDCKAMAAVVPLVNIAPEMLMTAAVAACD